MKIVLDTNVIVSGLLQSKGKPAQILALALSGAVQMCHNEPILAEYSEVLARPRFKFDARRVRDVLAKIRMDGLTVDASAMTKLELPDPDDEQFLAVALASSADFLVTGNIADYPHDKRRGCTVFTPADSRDFSFESFEGSADVQRYEKKGTFSGKHHCGFWGSFAFGGSCRA